MGQASSITDAIASNDQRVKVAALFRNVTSGTPSSWKSENSIDKWIGVKLRGKNVMEIVSRDTQMQGFISSDALCHLKDLLPHLEVLDISGHFLSGRCFLHQLPQWLERLDLTRGSAAVSNQSVSQPLFGAFEASRLPRSLIYLSLAGGHFSGCVDFASLPSSLTTLNLSQNNLSGPVGPFSWSTTPHLAEVHLDGNSMSGSSIDVCLLPQQLKAFNFPKSIKLVGDVSTCPLHAVDIIEQQQLDMISLGSDESSPQISVAEFCLRCRAFRGVDAVIATGDAREALLCLFCCVTNGLPVSWARDAPIKQWEGVKVNPAGDVVELELRGTKMSGSLNHHAMKKLHKLFPRLRLFDLTDHLLVGPCHLSNLPHKLEQLILQRAMISTNKGHGGGLSGPIDTSELPPTLRVFNVGGNEFCSFINIANIPRSVIVLSIASNSFSGTADLSKLPGGVTRLFLHGNKDLKLVGDINFFPVQIDEVSQKALQKIEVSVAGVPINGDDFFYRCQERAIDTSGGGAAAASAGASGVGPIEQQQQQYRHTDEKLDTILNQLMEIKLFRPLLEAIRVGVDNDRSRLQLEAVMNERDAVARERDAMQRERDAALARVRELEEMLSKK